MVDVQRTAGGGGGLDPSGYVRVAAEDPIQFTEQIGEWDFEFNQLKPGKFHAGGAVVALGGVHVAQVAVNQTLLHRGGAPRHTVAVLLPGAGSGEVFVRGQRLESGQCLTLAAGAALEAVTHGYYMDVAVAIDLEACRPQLDALTGGSLGIGPGTTLAAPGQQWTGNMLGRVSWLCATVVEQRGCLGDARRRASMMDHMLAAMAHFDTSPADIDSTTRSARAARRVAVTLACELIHSSLAEPLRLSELCRQAQLKVRSLEYGFREVTGLTPVAYIRSLRLNNVRRLLASDDSVGRSISEIAMDTGFWHLSQFAVDYRRFFGETPTQTRRRAMARASVLSAPN